MVYAHFLLHVLQQQANQAPAELLRKVMLSATQVFESLGLLTGVLNVHESSSVRLKQSLLNGLWKKKKIKLL